MGKISATVAILLLAAVIAVGIYLWLSLSDVAMSPAGYVALVLGCVATFALGVGLMALVFYSERKGYDERASGGYRPPPEDDRR